MGPAEQDRSAVILVVEDEMLVRMLAVDLLQDNGFHVIEARDGVEAVAILEVRDDVAAVVTDVSMPNMNGIAFAKLVSERRPHVGIVIMSGAMPQGVKLELPNNARFVGKPYLAEALLQELNAVLPRVSGPAVALNSLPTMQPGKPHGAGGIAQPLSEPDQS